MESHGLSEAILAISTRLDEMDGDGECDEFDIVAHELKWALFCLRTCLRLVGRNLRPEAQNCLFQLLQQLHRFFGNYLDEAKMIEFADALTALHLEIERTQTQFIATEAQKNRQDLELIFSGQAVYQNKLGRGSFATAYQVVFPSVDYTCALKRVDLRNPITSPLFTPEALEREACILQSLQHPNIAQYLAHYYSDHDEQSETYGAFNIVMEFVDGGTLTGILDHLEGGWPALSARQVLDWSMQMASALEYMHANWIYHRDLKPNNLMVTRRGVVKIIDFGLACRNSSAGTFVTTKTGTPMYASYEKTNGCPYDGRDDVWAIGCIILELLLGKTLVPASCFGVSKTCIQYCNIGSCCCCAHTGSTALHFSIHRLTDTSAGARNSSPALHSRHQGLVVTCSPTCWSRSRRSASRQRKSRKR